MKETEEIIYNLELSLLTPEVRNSSEKLNQLLADDFIEYGSSGLIYNKKITLDKLPSDNSSVYNIYDFELIPISDSVLQTRYKTDITDSDGNKLTSLRNSLWRKVEGGWQMFFHQGTPIS